jgi:uncharacterized membrane protein YphA (DoxX/SURF4 family)
MAGTGRGRRIALWVLSGLLAALYVSAGVPKLIGVPEFVEGFARMGYPSWFRLLIGGIEVVAGLALLVPRLAFYAAGALGVIMIGAIYTTVISGELGLGILVPIVCLGLLALVAYLRRTR